MSSYGEPVERLAGYFADRPTRAGLLARAALGRLAPGDDALREQLIARLRADTRPDGSVGGAVLPTAWRALELMDLGHAGDEPGTVRAVNWLLTVQGKPGAFGEGCTPDRHRHKVCEHYMSGFFAPAPASHRVAPITFPTGKVFRVEGPARFAVSALVLRAVLRAGHAKRPLVAQHVVSVGRLLPVWERWEVYFPPDLLATALGALGHAGEEQRPTLDRMLGIVAEHQQADGTFAEADLFHVLEALLAVHEGTHADEVRALARRAVPALEAKQRPDGTYGPTAREERALIALRTLLLAQEDEFAPI